jgi:hypothetical protein
MVRLRKLLRLSTRDRRLLAEAPLWVAAVRMGLWVVRFPSLRRFLDARIRVRSNGTWDDRPPIERIIWAVRIASLHLPRASCLTQALAAQILLGRRGHAADLRIGVARGVDGVLEAHAWLDCQGRVVIGGSEGLSRYTPLSTLQSVERATDR